MSARPLKVLLINDYGTATGGAELQLQVLREGLRARGHTARWFASHAGEEKQSPHWRADVSARSFAGGTQVLMEWHNPFAVRALEGELARFQPDIVHLQMFHWRLSPAILPALAAYPTIAHLQLYEPLCPTGSKQLRDGRRCDFSAGPACRTHCLSPWAAPFLLAAHRATGRHWSRFARRIAISQWQRKRYEAEGYPIDAVIPQGVPQPAEPLAALATEPRLTCAARLVPEKGIAHLLDAIAILAGQWPQLHAVIAGDGPEANALREQADRLGIAGQVEWLGFVPRHELDRHFAGAWLHIVPSMWEEPFGVVTVEALFRGTTVVASRDGASGEILAGHPFGALYPNGDVRGLAATMDRLLRDPDALAANAAAARAHAAHQYSEARMVERFVQLYREVLAG